MTSRWTYLLTDFRTGALARDHLPIRCDNFTDALGIGEGSMSGSLPLGAGVDVDDALLPWRRVIWPCKDDRPFGAYVVTALGGFGPKSTAVSFATRRVDAIFDRRELQSTLVFRQVDQLVIARAVLAYALGRTPVGVDSYYAGMVRPLPAADAPWIRLDDTMSGVLRDRLDDDDGYQAARHQKAASIVEDLSNLEDTGARAAQGYDGSFDYRLDYGRGTDGLPYTTIRLGYPRLGRTDVVLPLEYPGNITDWTYAADTSDTENHSRTYGSGQGVEKLSGAAAIDTAALSQGWPLLMGSDSGTASRQDTLDGNSRERLADHRDVNRGWTVQLRGDTLGTYDLGDVAPLHIQHRRWPGGRRALVRITGHKVEPARQGKSERITPTVVEVT